MGASGQLRASPPTGRERGRSIEDRRGMRTWPSMAVMLPCTVASRAPNARSFASYRPLSAERPLVRHHRAHAIAWRGSRRDRRWRTAGSRYPVAEHRRIAPMLTLETRRFDLEPPEPGPLESVLDRIKTGSGAATRLAQQHWAQQHRAQQHRAQQHWAQQHRSQQHCSNAGGACEAGVWTKARGPGHCVTSALLGPALADGAGSPGRADRFALRGIGHVFYRPCADRQ